MLHSPSDLSLAAFFTRLPGYSEHSSPLSSLPNLENGTFTPAAPSSLLIFCLKLPWACLHLLRKLGPRVSSLVLVISLGDM